MNQGTNLGCQVGRWLILAALVVALGALLLTIRPVGAQTTGCVTSGSGDSKKVICNYSFAEHGTGQVARLPARELDQTQVVKVWELVTDANDPAGDPTTDFPDYGDFDVDRKTGVLTFKSPPDYESPMDSDTDNAYKVRAKVGDGEKFLPVEITVRVTGIEEEGAITLSNRQPQVEVTLTATLADPDKGIRTPDWQWWVENDSGGWVKINEAVNARYTPRAVDVGKKLQAVAKYEDSHFTDIGDGTDYVEVSAVSEFPVRPKPASNMDPKFEEDEDTGTNGMQASRRIEENTPSGMNVGPLVLATDDDHLAADDPDDPGGPRDVLTYSLSDGDTTTTADGATADDGKFSIDHKTGQIMTAASLNKENLEDRVAGTDGIQLQVTAIATDPSGATGMITVTIHVLDEHEAPKVMGPAALTYFENQASGVADTTRLFRDPTRDTGSNAPVVTADTNYAIYRAIDSDLDDDDPAPVGGDIQWQLTGPDASKFRFGATATTYTNSGTPTPSSGVAPDRTSASAASPELQFRSAPTVKARADKGGTPGDNIYEVTVRAWDEDWLIGERKVTIRVADTNDEGSITFSHRVPQVGTNLTAKVNDADGVSGSITWAWVAGGETVSTSNTYKPTATDALTVTATYVDGGGRDATITGTPTDPQADPVSDGRNTAPQFYRDGLTLETPLDSAGSRVRQNEADSYDRYVLEGKTRNVTLTELEARTYDETSAPTDGILNVFDGYFATAADLPDPEDTTNPEGTLMSGTGSLQFDLSGPDAKYFSITNAATGGGLISTKGPLDFESQSTYTVTVTATDPGGLKDTVTVRVHAVDQAEIAGTETRIRVDENTKPITDLESHYNREKGGLKWSLLNTDGPAVTTGDDHNRNSVHSVDCQADATNDHLCDDFRFSNFNTANTTLLFALGEGEKHDAPDFEDPKDIDGTGDAAPTVTDGRAQAGGDNVYQVVVRVAFANLRSDTPANKETGLHPNPQPDEMAEETFEVWIRVVDVDEDPNLQQRRRQHPVGGLRTTTTPCYLLSR